MIFGSICSGIEAVSVAWRPLGWRAAFFAENAPFPSAVLAHHYPEVPNLGDITRFQWPDFAIDLLVGGTPCQSFSVAGLRAGLADPRGNLALTYLAVADRYRPRWLVWENVPGVRSVDDGRALGAFLGGLGELGYGWAYRSLDAQYFGVPQRRERVFVVGHLGNWQRAAEVLFEPESLRGASPPRREAGEGTAHAVAQGLGTSGRGFARAGDPRGQDAVIAFNHQSGGDFRPSARCDLANPLQNQGQSVAFGGNNTSGPIDMATAVNAHGGPHGRLDFESETFIVDGQNAAAVDMVGALGTGAANNRGFMAHGLRADGFDASEDGGDKAHVLTSRVRRLTPRECERLQGFADDYTLIPYRGKPAADGPRYKALGNSMAVPVVRWIGERIAAVDAV